MSKGSFKKVHGFYHWSIKIEKRPKGNTAILGRRQEDCHEVEATFRCMHIVPVWLATGNRIASYSKLFLQIIRH